MNQKELRVPILLYGEVKQSDFLGLSLLREGTRPPSCGSQAQCRGPTLLTKVASPQAVRQASGVSRGHHTNTKVHLAESTPSTHEQIHIITKNPCWRPCSRKEPLPCTKQSPGMFSTYIQSHNSRDQFF